MSREQLRIELDWFCGCGNPEAAARALLAVLDLHPLHDAQNGKDFWDGLGTTSRRASQQERYGMATKGQPTAEQFHEAMNAAAVERNQLEADKQMWATMAADLHEQVAHLRHVIHDAHKHLPHLPDTAKAILAGNLDSDGSERTP